MSDVDARAFPHVVWQPSYNVITNFINFSFFIFFLLHQLAMSFSYTFYPFPLYATKDVR